MAGLSETERYLFDTQGCIVLEDLLSPAEVEALLGAIPRGADGKITPAENAVTFRDFLGYEMGGFRGLIDHPRIESVLNELLFAGEDWNGAFDGRPYLMDAYGMVFRRGQTGPWFHNGGTPYEPWLSYNVRDGRFFCGLVGVVWALTDVNAGDGGFWYIPGSHKANFRLPKEIMTYERVPSAAAQPPMNAGSALIFAEALTHGTRNWVADHERIGLFYKYVPAYMPLLRTWPEEMLAKMTDAQRAWVTRRAK